MAKKKCNKCGELKPITEFWHNYATKDTTVAKNVGVKEYEQE